MEKLFENLPYLGYICQEFNKFVDREIFESKYHKFIRLTKVKIWYGTVDDKIQINENINGKFILGIQCDYHNSITGEIKQTKMNCGKLTSPDIITKDLELTKGDYITKLYICYNDILSYIKFITKQGQILELGKYDKDCEKTINFNDDKYPHMIQSFYGYYNDYGLRALGCIHIKRKNYFFLNIIDVFRYRHYLRTNEKEKEKWTNEKISELNYTEKAFIWLCKLPDRQFSIVIQFCC